ncbi:MAG TPA: cupin domain-containing protein [Nocardioidaceae bacterium]|nr:cupin domain-containing protein [Nocardioidaceae bacterium]
MDALELLSGDAQTFIDKVWASQVHVHLAAPADVVGLLSFDDVDHLLTSTGMRTPAVRLAQDGAVLPSSAFTRSATLAGVSMTGLVDARKVLDLFDSGATVVLQGLHRYWPPLTRLVRELELALGHPCQANAYLTPPGSQGFALHSDTHDVFTFQTHGRKLWEVHDASGAREVLMEPGTSMYLPTGTPHAARTQAVASLHVTVGINQVTWRQVLERALASATGAELDAHLPAGYLHDRRRFADDVGTRLLAVAETLRDLDAESVAAAEVERFLTTRHTAVPGGLRDRLAARELSDHTVLRRRPGSACQLVSDGDQLRVLLGDRELRVPARLREALEHVGAVEQLRPTDLSAWLDAESARVLTRRLVREGLLEVVG